MNDGSLRSGTVSASWRRPRPLPRRPRPPTTTLTQLASHSSKWLLSRVPCSLNLLARCLVCGTRLKGETEAQKHAKTTSHTNFSEV